MPDSFRPRAASSRNASPPDSFRPRAASSRNASPAGVDVVRAIQLAQEKGEAGVAAQNKGDFESAVIFYTSAISLRPESRSLVITILCNRATSLYAMGQLRGVVKAFNSALEDTKKVLRLDPTHYKALGIRGNIHLARLEFNAAAYCFRCASESAPTPVCKLNMIQEAEAAEALADSTREGTSNSPRPASSTQRERGSSSRTASSDSRSPSFNSERSRSESRGRTRSRLETRQMSKSRQRPLADYYELLGVPRNANQEEIKAARRKALLAYHPDRASGDNDKYLAVVEAGEILLSEEAKLQYDLDLLL